MSAKDYQKDYYEALGVPRPRRPPRSRSPTASSRGSGTPTRTRARRRRGAVQGNLRGVQRALRREAAQGVRRGALDVRRGSGCRPAAGRAAAGATSTSATSSAAAGERRRPRRRLRRDLPRRHRHGQQPGAARRGRGDRDHAGLRRRDRRRDRVPAADRRGCLPGLRRHGRQVGHRAQGLPGLPRHRAAVRNLGGFGLSEPCKTCRGRGLVVEDPCPACSGSGRAMSSRTIQARIPAGRGGRPADQDPGQGCSGRARRQGGRPVRPGARQAARGVRAERATT